MRPGNLSSSAELHIWRSPLPYLFIGLSVMMGLLAIALIVLACSHRKSSGSSSNSTLQTGNPVVLTPLEREPEVMVAVIMAGDDMPSFLAKPFDVTSSQRVTQSHCRHQATRVQAVAVTKSSRVPVLVCSPDSSKILIWLKCKLFELTSDFSLF